MYNILKHRQYISKNKNFLLKFMLFLSKLKTRIRLLLLKNIFSNLIVNNNNQYRLEKMGSDYGGWFVPANLITKDWVCYCAGVGEDASFDLALIKNFNCHVFAFDPTPRAIKYAGNIQDPNFHFYDYGVWCKQEELRFYEPKNSDHVSHSIVNLQNTSNYFVAHCKTVHKIAEELGHSKINLLKLDIEGAEFDVLNSIIENQVNIDVLLVEYDQPTSLIKIISSVKQLNKYGMILCMIDDWNFTFIKSY